MAGYTRQAAGNIVTGGVIDAADFNAEYNAIEAAFNASTGHTHDGTIGNGPPIENLGPSQDFIVTSSVVRAKTDDTYDLGTPTIEWKDGFFDGTLRTDILTVDETSTFTGNMTASADLSVGGNITVTGNATINGNLTLGNAGTDSVTFGADIDSSMIPDDDDTYDLGSSTQQWRDLYIDGTANIDSLNADTADINGGSIDGAVIGAANPAAITGTTITATSFVGPVTHPSISAAASSNNSGRTYIQDITLDGNGHVTGIATATETVTNTNTTYTADGNYGMTLSGTAFRLEDDRRRNSNSVDIKSGNTHDYTWYDHDVGIRWYTAGAEEMRLDNSGNLHVDANITAYSSTISDIRLKENLKPIKEPLEKLSKIQAYDFHYKKDYKPSMGVIAQEVQKVLPSAVIETEMPFHSKDPENPEKFFAVEYDQLIGLLVGAVNELKAEVDELKGKLREV